jgi:phage baseplate assembly protein W
MTVTLSTDITSNYWQLSTEEAGAVVTGVEDLKQQVLNCLVTDKGSVPFDPEFGFNIYELLDRPVNYVIPNGKLGILDALEYGVPSITISRIEHTFSQFAPEKVVFIVFCESNFGNFEVAVSNNPDFTPVASQGQTLGGFSGGFDSGFNITINPL